MNSYYKKKKKRAKEDSQMATSASHCITHTSPEAKKPHGLTKPCPFSWNGVNI